METTIFPYLFGRSGGAEISLLQLLEDKECEQHSNRLINNKKEIDLDKENLISLLFEKIACCEDVTVKKELIALKRDLYNDRDITNYSKLVTDNELLESLQALISKQKNYKVASQKFKVIFDTAFYATIKELKDGTDQFFFRNGLLFSSHLVAQQLEKSNLDFTTLNKKNKRLVLSIVRYLTRSTTKTTPFSSFNTIFWSNGKAVSKDVEGIVCSKLQVNNLFFYYLKKELLQYPSFRHQLEVKCNENLIENSTTTYRYFTNQDNNESFKTLGKLPVLEYLQNSLSDQSKTYRDVVNLLIEATESTEQQVIPFVEKLIVEGFLVVQFPIHHTDSVWIPKLSNYLEQQIKNTQDQLYTDILLLLDTILKTITCIEETFVIDQKKDAIEQCYHKIHSLFIDHQFSCELFEKMKPQDLFYEDTYQQLSETIPVKKQAIIAKNITQVYKALNCIPQKESFRSFLIAILQEQHKKTMPLLSFYEEVYLPQQEKFTFHKDQTNTFNTAFSKLKKDIVLFGAHNSIDLASYFSTPIEEKEMAFGAYFQILNKDSDQIVINDLSRGNGAAISRFLNLADVKVSENSKIYIQHQYPNHQVAEIKDASIHNTNNYPPLANQVISITEDTSLAQNYQLLSIADLTVKVQENDLIVVDKNEQPVKLLNTSMEGMSRRSKFMQFLDVFDTTDITGYSTLLYLIMKLYTDMLDNQDIVVVPRLVFGDHVIVQRKKWLVKKEVFTNMFSENRNERHLIYQELNYWCTEHGIPQEVFIKIKGKNPDNSQDDNYKPQYINFKTPSLLLLFINMIEKGSDIIEITEMSPNTPSVKDMGGKVQEYILNVNQ
ncbi:lantibiotic dehydratase [Aquimarina sp. 2201CG1-2-11]|uniref:lantibiotic dehydratase n=1 Tax=Aquimarina discodermiae TaxID=3231043 RepID=UPI0034622E32